MPQADFRLDNPPYAALWKSSIWRIQLVSGFHLGKIWATTIRPEWRRLFRMPMGAPRRTGVDA